MEDTHRETETTGLARSGASQPSARAGRSDANGSSLSQRSLERAHRRARALGWFSLGLGLTEVLAPRGVARAIGIGDDVRRRRTLRALGLRELASGIGLLSRPRPTGWMLSRLAGDLMNLALLGRAMTGRKVSKTRVPVAIASVLGVAALDFVTSRQLRQADRQGLALPEASEMGITGAITVGRPPEEVYGFWRDVKNLPQFMSLIESVEMLDDRRARWTLGRSGKKLVQWQTEVTEDQPGERIAWRTSDGAPFETRGEVRFRRAPGGRGTEVLLTVKVNPPGGALGAAVARLIGKVPAVRLQDNLRRLKQVMELGEVVHSDASVHLGPHPARPSATLPPSVRAPSTGASSGRPSSTLSSADDQDVD